MRKIYKASVRPCAALSLLCLALSAQAQSEDGGGNALSHASRNITIGAEAGAAASSGDDTPLWLTANRYGLSGMKGKYGYLRASASHDAAADSARNWRIGWGVDLAGGYDMEGDFVVQQLYADFDWQSLRLSVGSKERPSELKNAALSSGGMTESMNARPVPQVRLSLPDFWNIPGTHGWLALKGHIAYGKFTDGGWQESFVAKGQTRSDGVLYHSKAGFLRIGNKDKFPLTFTGGLEMAAQFGGEAWNTLYRDDDQSYDPSHVKMSNGLKAFWNAFVPGGSDQSDGDFANTEGNQLGSWHFSLDFHGKGWGLRAYAEHFFEDHSQMFFEYGWKDMLIGTELTLPRNPFISTVLYEHIRTTDQSGSMYHDQTASLPYQVSGNDNYYNHAIYASWQHWGQLIGNPLLTSPGFNDNGSLRIYDNRIKANHFGVCGQPTSEIDWRLLMTHVRSLGTYELPSLNPKHANYFLFEAGYAPRWAKGFSLRAAVATNGGSIIDKSNGGLLTLRWTGAVARR